MWPCLTMMPPCTPLPRRLGAYSERSTVRSHSITRWLVQRLTSSQEPLSYKRRTITIIAQEIEKDTLKHIKIKWSRHQRAHIANQEISYRGAGTNQRKRRAEYIRDLMNGFVYYFEYRKCSLTSSGSDLLMSAHGSKLFSRSTWMPVRMLTWCRRLLTFSKERSSCKKTQRNCYSQDEVRQLILKDELVKERPSARRGLTTKDYTDIFLTNCYSQDEIAKESGLVP